MTGLTHLDEKGEVSMVNISSKAESPRIAIGYARLRMKHATLVKINSNLMEKGNVTVTSKVAGIMAAKLTPNLIPLCHPINLEDIAIELEFDSEEEAAFAKIFTRVATSWKTGAEMEALVAASLAALALYDMIKGVEKGAIVEKVQLLYKSGGKSGIYKAQSFGVLPGKLAERWIPAAAAGVAAGAAEK